MDDEVPIAGETDNVTFRWLAAYPPGVPARIGTPPYGLLGEIAPDLAARRPSAPAFTTIMPNGMAARLTFAEVDRYSDAFAAYLRETLRLEPGARVAIQSSKRARLSGRGIRYFQGGLRARQCQSALYRA